MYRNIYKANNIWYICSRFNKYNFFSFSYIYIVHSMYISVKYIILYYILFSIYTL